MKLTRRGFLAGAGAVAAGSAAWGLDPNRAWADEEVAEEPAGTDEAPAEEPAAPAGPVVVCEECPGACTLVLEVEDGRVAAVRGDGANPFSEGRLCLRAQALTDLWKAPEGATEDGAGGDGGERRRERRRDDGQSGALDLAAGASCWVGCVGRHLLGSSTG